MVSKGRQAEYVTVLGYGIGLAGLAARSRQYLAMSIAGALFSDSKGHLFRWPFGQPERSCHLSKLRRLTELGSAALQRELNRRLDAGRRESDWGSPRCAAS